MIGGIEQYGRLGIYLLGVWFVVVDLNDVESIVVVVSLAEQRLLAAEKVHAESRVDR